MRSLQLSSNWFSVCWLGYPFDPEAYAHVYEGEKKHFFVRQADGSAFMSGLPGTTAQDIGATCKAIACAREIGDEETYAVLSLSFSASPSSVPLQGPFEGTSLLVFQ